MSDRSPCQCGFQSLSPDADGSAVCGGCGRPLGPVYAPAPPPSPPPPVADTDTHAFQFPPPADPPDEDPPAVPPDPSEHVVRIRKKTTLPPPDVPGYEILGELGRGGMGVVYKAREKVLNRVVALKMILAGAHAGEVDRARFRKEAEAVAALHHAGIVQIFHVGEHAGQPYLVLEYVDGGTLAERMGGGNLMTAREAAVVVGQIAATMQYAHEQGVIHRDLKPANILISSPDRGTRSGDSGSAPGGGGSSASALRAPNSTLFKISDFGLAKKLDETVAAGGGTRTGAVMGTPSYISPEQAAGKASSVTARSDVYSLGAILYEMLTDRPPFKADTPLETVLQVIHDEPVPPSKLRPKLPRDLETICLKCLSKDPLRRYATAGELADDLGRFLRGEPIRARPVGAVARGWKWVRRHPAITAFAATAAAAIATVVAVLVSSNANLTDANRLKEQEAKTAREQTALANAAKEEADRLAGERQEALDDLAAEAERSRRSLFALELAQIAGSLDRDSVAALRRLNDPAKCPPDLRDFIWRYLRRLCARAEKVHAHRKPVRAMAVSADGLLVATGDTDGGIQLWNPHTNTVYAWLSGGPGGPGRRADGVSGLAFTPDGRAVAAVSADGWVRAWRLDAEFLDAVRLAAGVLPDTQAELNKLIPSGSLSRVLRPTTSFRAFEHAGRCITFSPDGRWLAAGGSDRERVPGQPDGVARAWEAGAVLHRAEPNRAAVLGGAGGLGEWATTPPGPPKPVKEVKEHFAPVVSVAFSPDNTRLATGGEDRGVILTPMAGNKREELPLHGGPVFALAFSPDGRTLATADNDETPVVVLWDVTNGKRAVERKKLVGHADAIRGLAFTADGRTLASAGMDRTVRVWEIDTGTEMARLYGHGGAVHAVGWLPDRRALVSAAEDATARVWQTTLKTCESVNLLPADAVKGKVQAAALTADGKVLATADNRGVVRLWATDKLFDGRQQRAELPTFLANGKPADAREWQVFGLAVSDDGEKVAAATADGGRVWDRTAGTSLFGKALGVTACRTLLPGREVRAVRFTPAGDRLFALTAAGLRVFDPATATDITPPTWLTADVDPTGFDLAISPDGRTVAAAGQRGTQPGIIFADPDGVRFAPTADDVTSLDFAPDGTKLVTAFATRPARVWAFDPTGTALSPAGETDEPLPLVRFCREGKSLYGVRANREVVLFDADTGVERGKLDGHADRIVGLGLTPKDAALISVGRDGVAKRWNAEPPRFDGLRPPGQGPRR